MTVKSNVRSVRAASALAVSLGLAPQVVAMRLPVMFLESLEINPWRVETVRANTEKAAALMEGAIAAQTVLVQSASRFWFELMTGRTPSLVSGVALQQAAHAAMRPSGRRVRANYRRLRAK